MPPLKFIPGGIPLSSSFAISCSVTLNVDTYPISASYVEYVSVSPAGPTGSAYTSSWATYNPIDPNLGLI